MRSLNTIVQMASIANNMHDTHLRYRKLIRDDFVRQEVEMADLTLD